VAPFDIQIGRAVVVSDPWDNQLVLLDSSKGQLITDGEGRVVGVGRRLTEERLAQGEEAATRGYDGLYERALRFAARAHRGQTRKGTDVPYITHPVHVAAIVRHYGFPEEAIVAGLLHDVVEDQGVSLAAIQETFGATVAETVGALSECRLDRAGEVRPWHVRKAEAVEQIRKASAEAAAVKAADVLHNGQSILYDLRLDGAAVWLRFTKSPQEMLGYYTQIAALVRTKLGGHPLVGELLSVLAELEQAACDARLDQRGGGEA
jgi:(p)ppGpp synthase/HD superfamily hydrolase